MGTTVFVTREELAQGISLPSGTRHKVVVRDRVVALRLSGMLFDTNKCFLLPASLPHLKRNLSKVYKTRADNELLIVGHTDTSGESDYNDVLSLERANAVKAYLEDDVETWLAQYKGSVAVKKRWGDAEDRLMFGSVPAGRTEEVDPVRDFQSSRGLAVDGIIGPVTRRRLIEEYMEVDSVTKPASMKTTVHGCGELFPLDPTGLTLDNAPADGQHDALDRRVELFFFHGPIEPAPPGKNSKAGSTEYPEWRKAAKIVFEQTLGPLPVLRVKFEFDGKVAANAKYELRVDGHLLAITSTADDGLIDQVIPERSKVAEIYFPDKDITRALELVKTTEFPAVTDVRGVQVRLAQLGFFPGPATGSMNESTELALRKFKVSRGLPDDAGLDSATQDELTLAYGS